MRKFLAILCVGAALAFPAYGQKAGGKDTIGPTTRVSQTELELLHEALRTRSNLHDEYLYLASMGTKETVPLLLDRLRLDYGVDEPPPGVVMAFDCAQGHLVDALRAITNTDQGMFYPRWSAWWEKNRDFTREQWISNGFQAAGLHVSDPVDNQFALELIELAGRRRGYLSLNGNKILASAPQDRRIEWVIQAANLTSRSSRLGAIEVFPVIVKDGHVDILRKLAADDDPAVRHQALTALNAQLRKSLLASTALSGRQLLKTSSENWIRGVSFARDLLVVVFRNGEVKALDAHTWEKRWSYVGPFEVGDLIAATRDQIVLAAHEGSLLALDYKGQMLWHEERKGDQYEVQALVPWGTNLIVARSSQVEIVDPKSGAIKSKIPAVAFVRDADATANQAFFIDGQGLRSVSANALPELRISKVRGVSVSSRSVCVVSGGREDNEAMCLSPDRLTVQWTAAIGSQGTWGHLVAPVQDGERVYVPTNDDLSVFNASDGSLIWRASGGQEAFSRIVPTQYGLLLQDIEYKLEMRDPKTGEVRRIWPEMRGVRCLAVRENFAAVADMDEKLWLVDLSK